MHIKGIVYPKMKLSENLLKHYFWLKSSENTVLSESAEKYAQIKHRSQAKTVFQPDWICSFSLHKMIIDGQELCGLLVAHKETNSRESKCSESFCF